VGVSEVVHLNLPDLDSPRSGLDATSAFSGHDNCAAAGDDARATSTTVWIEKREQSLRGPIALLLA
jgi:hypothetical protein